ncbi:hypothetical protein Sango_2074200 [Sesamum angolense]|uniref:Rhamnogalacturonan lyase domain-containing protein n=1 Tax=Sesamum angolense TaxID=2727404 RepID=A0AAE2BLU2_9LAMI|nr:hypothetical protein Sango_2074200 [Sesamum angolense]
MTTGMVTAILEDSVVIDNGVFQLTLSNPGGIIRGIQYNGIDNLLELHNKDLNGGFWDLNWSEAGSTKTKGKFDTIEGTSLRVIVENEEQVELSFTRTWDPSVQGEQAPLSIDRRFVMLRGSPGFYCYAIFDHSEDFPGFNLNTTRIAFMLRKDKFHYMAIADDRQRYMPLPDDRLPGRGQQLAYPEAVLLVDPVEPEFKGEVDDKYNTHVRTKIIRCMDGYVLTHLWVFGKLHQAMNSIFVTSHYAGEDLILKFQPGEIWKKVFGPVFIYLNSVSDPDDAFSFGPMPKNRCISEDAIPAKAAYVGLALQEMMDRGKENLRGINFGPLLMKMATLPLMLYVLLTIICCDIDVGELTYEPPRNGPTLWEIGIPDRTAAEFYIPDPNPMYINKLYVNHPDRFRQYGLWERYTDLFPDKDLVYTVGVSDYRKDWFYAQVTRRISENSYKSTTWQIKFNITTVDEGGTYTLRLALASAHNSELQVRVNDPDADPPLFSTGVIGADNAIARHGIHGIYWLFNVDVPAAQLMQGENTIYLTQAKASSPFQVLLRYLPKNLTLNFKMSSTLESSSFDSSIDSSGSSVDSLGSFVTSPGSNPIELIRKKAKAEAEKAQDEENLKLICEITTWWKDAHSQLKTPSSKTVVLEGEKLVPDWMDFKEKLSNKAAEFGIQAYITKLKGSAKGFDAGKLELELDCNLQAYLDESIVPMEEDKFTTLLG